MRTLTPSAIAAYVSCPYRYNLSYNFRISPIKYRPALIIGSGIHAGILHLHTSPNSVPLPNAMVLARQAMKEMLLRLKPVMEHEEFMESYEQAKRDRAKVIAMLRAYHAVQSYLPMIKSESSFKPRPIINPVTGKNSRTFNLAGILDGVYTLPNGKLMLYELKSTSDSLKEASTIYSASIQPQLYLSMVDNLDMFAGICIDLVKKPITPFKRPVSRAKKPKPVEVVTEPLDDYENRCLKAFFKQPERYFRRLILPIDPSRIRYAREVAWRVAQEIRDSDRYGYLACRGMNCKNMTGWCDYQSLCWYDNVEDYQHGEYAHEELELAE